MANRKNERIKRQAYEIYVRDNKKCFYCDIEVIIYDLEFRRYGILPNDAMTVDHIIPRSMGGLRQLDNLICSCYKCNNDRGSTPAETFLARKIQKQRNLGT